MDESDARAIMASGLGKAELEFVTSLVAPLFWVIRDDGKIYRARNGSAFFLDAGDGPIGVTANHVIEEWQNDCLNGDVVALQLGDLPVDLEDRNRLIDFHKEIDIATFRISAEEIQSISKSTLTGQQNTWPPGPPQKDRGIYFAGFPVVETKSSSPDEFSFGAAAGGGVASSISETNISTLIERQHLIGVMGVGVPPENYNFSGISGGPMLTVIEQSGIRSWALAGVLYQGPNPSDDPEEAIAGLEIIQARRAHFILPSGRLDIKRWEESRP